MVRRIRWQSVDAGQQSMLIGSFSANAEMEEPEAGGCQQSH